jgi:hypothetical protein
MEAYFISILKVGQTDSKYTRINNDGYVNTVKYTDANNNTTNYFYTVGYIPARYKTPEDTNVTVFDENATYYKYDDVIGDYKKVEETKKTEFDKNLYFIYCAPINPLTFSAQPYGK